MKEETLVIRNNRLKMLDHQHPWVFSGALFKAKSVKAGAVVRLEDAQGRFLLKGHMGSGSIAIRVLSREDVPLDATFWKEKIQHAIKLRLALNLLSEDNNCFRLIHGEGDYLPGLVVDYYNGLVVLQCHSLGMLGMIDMISDAIKDQSLMPVKAVYNKSASSLSKIDDSVENGLVYGELSRMDVLENGISYTIDAETGQKTGFFIDQRENRLLLNALSKDKSVLNTFSYTGGFSISALKGGASSVVSIDASKVAIAGLESNIELNDFSKSKHESLVGDVMSHLKDSEENYDIVILDPPAFAKSREKRHKAIQAYKRLNLLGMNRVNPGGFLMTFSCSQVVDEDIFYKTILSAGLEHKGKFRVIKKLSQGPDHPVDLFHSEGRYLKGLLLQRYS